MADANALLLVFTHPGDALPIEEYHGWYEDEHIPLRMVIPDFKTCSRLVAADGEKPTWAATYDLTSVDSIKTDAYKKLGTDRSEREKSVLAKMEYLERRIYRLNIAAPVTVSDEYVGHKEGMILVIVSISIPPEHESEFHRWYDEEHVPLLRKVPGWLRTRRFILEDSGAAGALKGTEGFKPPPKFLAMHEYADDQGLSGPEWKAAVSTPWRDKIFENVQGFERRILKVYKTF